MEFSAILCNHAEVQNNMLYMNGGGIDRTFIPPGTGGPVAVNIAIAIVLGVPWTQTNQEHALNVTLLDADDQPVQVQTGPDTSETFRAEMKFNVGRPPNLDVGEAQSVSLAINMPGLPMPSLGRYFFVMEVDGTEMKRLPYSIVSQPGAVFQQ